MTTQTRRNFLATLGVAALGVVSSDTAAAAGNLAPDRRIDRIGLQLYTVRDLMGADMAGTLAKVAAIGYKEVEFAGYFGRTPREVRDLLEQNRLTSPSTHLPYDSFLNWQQALDESSAIGHKWVTLASIPEERRRTIADWNGIAAQLNKVGAQAKSSGLRFAYHNHDFELKPIDGVKPLDVLLRKTDPALVDFEMDIYWMYFGGGDPFDYFNRFPNRFAMAHVKDSSGPPNPHFVDVGQGKIDFRSIFAQSSKAGFRHYFVEHDQPTDPITTIRNSYSYLHALRY